MSLPTVCPHCRANFKIPLKYVGKKGRCPKCRKVFLAKSGTSIPPPPSAAIEKSQNKETEKASLSSLSLRASSVTDISDLLAPAPPPAVASQPPSPEPLPPEDATAWRAEKEAPTQIDPPPLFSKPPRDSAALRPATSFPAASDTPRGLPPVYKRALFGGGVILAGGVAAFMVYHLLTREARDTVATPTATPVAEEPTASQGKRETLAEAEREQLIQAVGAVEADEEVAPLARLEETPALADSSNLANDLRRAISVAESFAFVPKSPNQYAVACRLAALITDAADAEEGGGLSPSAAADLSAARETALLALADLSPAPAEEVNRLALAPLKSQRGGVFAFGEVQASTVTGQGSAVLFRLVGTDQLVVVPVQFEADRFTPRSQWLLLGALTGVIVTGDYHGAPIQARRLRAKYLIELE